MESPYILAAGASFLAGVFGYIIVRFWIVPISRYRRAKRASAQAISDLRNAAGGHDAEAAKKACRVAADRLSESYSVNVPPWYRMVLAQRNESPVEAAKDLLALANAREPDRRRVLSEAIRKSLGL